MPNITYSEVIDYLEAITKANSDSGNGDIDSAAHGRFWLDAGGNKLSRDAFVRETLPNVRCQGQPIPLVNADPVRCPFYQALVGPSGWCNKGQMPKGGPYITDPNVMFTLSNGAQISGTDIQKNIVWWLTNSMPN